MKVEITDMNTGEVRVAKFDGRYEMGYDSNGRKCRVSCHGISSKKLSADVYTITGGNKYRLIKDWHLTCHSRMVC